MDSVGLGTPIRTYGELRDEIAKLEEPRPGYVRVYRGQTRDYATMLPTSLRPGGPRRDAIWHYCAMLFARELSAANKAAFSEDEAVCE